MVRAPRALSLESFAAELLALDGYTVSARMTQLRNALDDPAVVGRITEILQLQWDPAGAVRDALGADGSFYREQATVVTGMLAAEARETEVQRYLRQLEQQALPTSLHPTEVRHAIAVALWRVARGLPP